MTEETTLELVEDQVLGSSEEETTTITFQDALEVARRVRRIDPTGDPRKDTPFVGKEDGLFDVMKRAEQAHRDAMWMEAAAPRQRKANRELRKALEKALSALKNSPINLAVIDPELDRSYEEPDSEGDLQGLLRRAIAGLQANEHVISPSTDRSLRAASKDDEGRDVRVKTSGLKALVGVLYDYVRQETDLAFTDSMEEDASNKDNGINFSEEFWKKLEKKGEKLAKQRRKKRPSSLSLMLVYEVARLMDPQYTLEQCSSAMRPR